MMAVCLMETVLEVRNVAKYGVALEVALDQYSQNCVLQWLKAYSASERMMTDAIQTLIVSLLRQPAVRLTAVVRSVLHQDTKKKTK